MGNRRHPLRRRCGFPAAQGRAVGFIRRRGSECAYLPSQEQELNEVERLFPAEHYVLVDDKLRLLAATKQAWGTQVTTVFPNQGHYAHDPEIRKAYPRADISVERIGDLLEYDLPAILAASRDR